MLLDTIAAISTPRGEGGISIVRMSGQDSLNILEKIFRPKNKKASELKNYSINYGHIIDNEHIVDEVLVSIMKAPNTYTREDIVEINCHGGFLVTEKVLEVVLKNGARIAEIGEFKRIGRLCRCVNISSRICFNVPFATLIMIRLYI